MIEFSSTIYCDALSLLTSKECNDIKAFVADQMRQGEYEIDQIRREIDESLLYEFERASVDDLLKCISIEEDNIEFDYGESQACNNLRCVAFSVPCLFDDDEFYLIVCEMALKSCLKASS